MVSQIQPQTQPEIIYPDSVGEDTHTHKTKKLRGDYKITPIFPSY